MTTKTLFHAPMDVADVERLLMCGADVDATDAFGNTPLHVYATQCPPGPQKYAILRLLMMHGARPDAKNAIWRTPLHGAVWAGDAGAVDILARTCDFHRTMDEEGVTPIDMAFERDEPDVIAVFVKHMRDRAVCAMLSLCERRVDYQCAKAISRMAFSPTVLAALNTGSMESGVLWSRANATDRPTART